MFAQPSLGEACSKGTWQSPALPYALLIIAVQEASGRGPVMASYCFCSAVAEWAFWGCPTALDSPWQVSVSHFVPSKVVVMALKLDINQDTLWLKVLPDMCAQNMEFHLYRRCPLGSKNLPVCLEYPNILWLPSWHLWATFVWSLPPRANSAASVMVGSKVP